MNALWEFTGSGLRAGGISDSKKQSSKQVWVPDSRFRELVETHQNRVFSISYAILGNAQDADEAAQKVFASIYRSHYLGRERNEILWVCRLAVKQCLRGLRTRRRKRLFAWLRGGSSDSTVAEILGGSERGKKVILLRALATMPDVELALLVLKEVADQSVEDIAAIMRMDLPEVHRGLVMARTRLLKGWSSIAER